MATQAVTDLCKIILRDVYGEVAETIVGSLLEYGRLTAQQIAKHTDLSVSAVKGALVALVQNRFVLFWIDPATPKICHYSANYKEIIHVLSSGSILDIISSKFSDNNSRAPEIVKNILVYGHVRAVDYLEHANSEDNTADQDEYETDKNRNSLSRSMTDLVIKRYLTPLYDFDFQPPSDIYQQIYKNNYAKQARGQSENARAAAATSAAILERDTLFGSRDAPDAGLIPIETKGNQASAAKRVRRNQVGLVEPKYTVNPEAVFAVNHDRFLLSFRNDELAKLATKTIGPVTGKVYRQLLRCYENKLFRCSQTVSQTADYFITTMSIMQGLDPSLDLKNTIVMPSYNGGKRKDMDDQDQNGISKKLRTNTGGFIMDNGEDDEDDDMDSKSDDMENSYSESGSKITLVNVSRHLDLLASSPYNFVIKAGNRGGGEWFVPFEELRETMKRVSYEQIIENKFGPLALRLFRIIKDKGMVNDELLARTALLRADTIAQLAATLHDFGALDLQEVPRSNDRTPVKTFFLWFHNPKRSYGIILQDMYKALSRMYKRILAERKEHPILLAKLDREDVKENEDMYLSAAEKQEIYELRSLEEKLLVQIDRLQGLTRIFDDY